MLAGLARQAMGGALLRARMEARKAAFAAAAGLLMLGALTMAGAAGLIVLAARYGIIAGLLGGAGLLLLLAVIVFLLGRRVPGAEASASAVRAEGALENVPAPGLPQPDAVEGGVPSGLAAFSQLHETVRGRIDGVMPPGGQGAVTALAASQLAKRPAATLGAALAIGAAVGLLRRQREERASQAATDAAAARPDPAVAPSGVHASAQPGTQRGVRRRQADRPVQRRTDPPAPTVRVHDA